MKKYEYMQIGIASPEEIYEWSGEYGEVTSTSNCTDYQARRLNIKYKDDDGKNKYVHTLNGTAIAVGDCHGVCEVASLCCCEHRILCCCVIEVSSW